MPDTSVARRKLRAITATHTRLGNRAEADAARTALAVQGTREHITDLGRARRAPSPAEVELLDEALDEVRAWAEEQAAVAPPIRPETARMITTALRGGAA